MESGKQDSASSLPLLTSFSLALSTTFFKSLSSIIQFAADYSALKGLVCRPTRRDHLELSSAFRLSLAELFDFPSPKKSERSLLELRILTLIRNQNSKVLDLIWNVVDQVDQWTKKGAPSSH
jgi:hypothetical protein